MPYLSSSILTPALTMPFHTARDFSTELDLQLMTTVAGNVSVENYPQCPATAAFLDAENSARPRGRCAAGTRTA
ncbi:hypothetical protein ACLK1S_00195 [Escherichia coli]